MQISITARGIDQFQSKFTAYEKKQSSIISSFSTVKSKTRNASGGVGNMQGALNSISARIKREETKKTAAQTIRKKADGFVERTRQTDRQVAEKVKQSSDAFYKKYPKLKPASDDKPWYEQIWDQLCKGVDAIKEGLKNLWDSAVQFYNKHKKIIDTILIVVGAIAAIVGLIVATPAALVGLLTALGVSAATAATISAVVFATAMVSTILAAIVNIVDVWAEIDHWLFNSIQTGLNVISAITTFAIDIGGMYNALAGLPKVDLHDAARASDTFMPDPDMPGEMVEIKVLSDYVPGADDGIDRICNMNHRKFYSVDNVNGGKVYVTVNTIDYRNPFDLREINQILDNVTGEVNILTGVHGDVSGKMKAFGQFVINDTKHWGDLPNFNIIDVSKLSIKELETILNRPAVNICNWCFSERSIDVLKALGFK